jgi:hypothetical protein
MKKLVLSTALILSGFITYAQDVTPALSQTEPKYELVERSRRAHFVAAESYLKQEGKVICNYIIEPNGEDGQKYTFTLPNGTVAAVAIMKRYNMGKVVVETMIDKKKHTVGLKNIDDINIAREIGMFLSDNKYI